MNICELMEADELLRQEINTANKEKRMELAHTLFKRRVAIIRQINDRVDACHGLVDTGLI